jgi:hypothetical protein
MSARELATYRASSASSVRQPAVAKAKAATDPTFQRIAAPRPGSSENGVNSHAVAGEYLKLHAPSAAG